MSAAAEMVRPARPEDAARIVEVLHECADPLTRSRTVFGCPGAVAYVEDAVRAQEHGGDALFTVCLREGRVVGFTEFRRGLDEVFLNHVHVEPASQRGGTGRRLLAESLRRVRDAAQPRVGLDVFETNERAYAWYRALGFRLRHETVWAECPPVVPAADAPPRWIARGLPAAEALHARYGFSQLTLETPRGSHPVGRLGHALFRVTAPALLQDAAALAALATLGPERRLLYVGPEEGAPEGEGWEVLGRSHRLVAEAGTVLERLEAVRGAEAA